MKLLAKIAEERYQTAAGVEHDSGGAVRMGDAGRIAQFPLAEHDVAARLLIPRTIRPLASLPVLGSFNQVVASGRIVSRGSEAGPPRRARPAETEHAAPHLPFGTAPPEVVLDAGGCLVALLRDLGEQLHDKLEIGAGRLQPLAWRIGVLRLAMDPFRGSCALNGSAPVRSGRT